MPQRLLINEFACMLLNLSRALPVSRGGAKCQYADHNKSQEAFAIHMTTVRWSRYKAIPSTVLSLSVPHLDALFTVPCQSSPRYPRLRPMDLNAQSSVVSTVELAVK